VVRLADWGDDLSDVVGKVGSAFAKVLDAALLSATAMAEKRNTERTLTHFHYAADKLRTSREEASKNHAPRDNNSKPSPMELLRSHLPSKKVATDMHEYHDTVRELLAVNPKIGGAIVRQEARRGVDPSAKQRRLPFPQP